MPTVVTGVAGGGEQRALEITVMGTQGALVMAVAS